MDMIPIDLAVAHDPGWGHADRLVWKRLLKANCEVLHRLAPEMADAISVSVRLPSGSSAEVDELKQVSRRLAEEYRLIFAVHINGRSAAVRFSRGEEGSQDCASLHPRTGA